jgi:hypothetical protein
MNGSPPEKERSRNRWGPPPDSDLVGLPMFVGLGAAIAAISAAFIFLGGLAGLLVLIVVLVLALAISYRVVTDSETEE